MGNRFFFKIFFFTLHSCREENKSFSSCQAGDVVLVSDAVVRIGRGAAPAAEKPLLLRTASAMHVSWMEAAQNLRPVEVQNLRKEKKNISYRE